MQTLLFLVVAGLEVGSIYALMALGYYLVSSATGILNFAQGEWAMTAAVSSVALLAMGVPYPIAILGGLAAATVLAGLSNFAIIGPLQHRGASLDTMVVALLGVLIVVRYGTGLVVGRSEAPLPPPFEGRLAFASGFQVSAHDLTIIFGTLGIYALVWLFLNRTWTGRSFRVTALNPLGAQICGINLRRMRALAFASGAIVAGIAGWLYAPLYAASYLMGGVLGLKGFLCMIIGGVSSPLGPLVGGLLIGLLEVFAAYYIGSLYSEAVGFVLLLVILTLRPSGLLGRA